MESNNQTKIAVVSVIISDSEASEKVNLILHEFRSYVLGRMGLPYREKKLSIISVVLDAPQEVINSLSGKLGMISGVKSKVLLTK